jgi:hypothetical protein
LIGTIKVFGFYEKSAPSKNAPRRWSRRPRPVLFRVGTTPNKNNLCLRVDAPKAFEQTPIARSVFHCEDLVLNLVSCSTAVGDFRDAGPLQARTSAFCTGTFLGGFGGWYNFQSGGRGDCRTIDFLSSYLLAPRRVAHQPTQLPPGFRLLYGGGGNFCLLPTCAIKVFLLVNAVHFQSHNSSAHGRKCDLDDKANFKIRPLDRFKISTPSAKPYLVVL